MTMLQKLKALAYRWLESSTEAVEHSRRVQSLRDKVRRQDEEYTALYDRCGELHAQIQHLQAELARKAAVSIESPASIYSPGQIVVIYCRQVGDKTYAFRHTLSENFAHELDSRLMHDYLGYLWDRFTVDTDKLREESSHATAADRR